MLGATAAKKSRPPFAIHFGMNYFPGIADVAEEDDPEAFDPLPGLAAE